MVTRDRLIPVGCTPDASALCSAPGRVAAWALEVAVFGGIVADYRRSLADQWGREIE